MSILDPINDLVAWVIMHIYNVLGPDLGANSGVTWVLSIALLVVAMRLVMLPLFIKQMHTQRAMTALTPRINEIRKKYKGDKEKLNAETMKLYQEAGVNPLMGCLPVLLQMPLFFALFSVLREIAEYKAGTPLKYNLKTSFVSSVSKAQVFGVSIKDTFLHGTSIHVHVVVALVVLVSMATTYLTVRQSMKRGMMPTGPDNPMGQSQKMMGYIMPLFALSGLYWPFGLVLYWVLTNLWTLGQQYMLLRKYPVGAAAAAIGGNLPIGKSPAAGAAGLTSGAGKPKPVTGGSAGSAGKRPGVTAKAADAAKASGQAAKNGAAESSQAAAASVSDAVGEISASSNGSASNGSSGKAGAGTGGEPVRDSKPAKPPVANNGPSAASRASSSANGTANGQKTASEDGGMLRRFTRSRPEPVPPVPVEPETKIVRQQPQRQSRSKRSGKR